MTKDDYHFHQFTQYYITLCDLKRGFRHTQPARGFRHTQPARGFRHTARGSGTHNQPGGSGTHNQPGICGISEISTVKRNSLKNEGSVEPHKDGHDADTQLD